MSNLRAIFSEEELKSLVNRHPAKLAQMLSTPECIPELMGLIIQAEVTGHCGIAQKHSNTKCKRWGTNPGSVFWNGAQVPMKVPRVRNTETNREVPLETYKSFHAKNPGFARNLTRSVLCGISQRKFGQTAEHVAESFGLSGSTIGRVFKEETEKALEHFMTRRFDDLEFVAILIDGKTLREEQILLAVGLTTKGEKIILGFVEAKTESHSCVVALLQDLQERGFQVATTLLVLLDGGKGLRKGVLEVFGEQALIQRCQWHKRENVTSKIQDPDFAAETRKKMEAAYAADTYDQAKGQLQTLMQVLDDRCPKAAASLREGLEETLTLHKLGVVKLLRDRLRTTNIIESINGGLAHTTRRVTRWCNSNQRQRWIAAACLDIEENSLNAIPQDWQWEGLLRALKRHSQTKKHHLIPRQRFKKIH